MTGYKNKNIQSLLALILRIILSLVLIFLGFNHLLNPSTFEKTLELPLNNGIFFNWFYKIILQDSNLFFLTRSIVGTLELIFGVLVLFGIFVKLVSALTSFILCFIIISLIPSWFMVFVHSFSLIIAIPLIFLENRLFIPFEKFIPEKMKKFQ